MIKFRLLPCKTTCACDTSSSGTYGAGTETTGRPLLGVLVPIITGAPRLPVFHAKENCVEIKTAIQRHKTLKNRFKATGYLPLLLPPRIVVLERIIRARVRANWRPLLVSLLLLLPPPLPLLPPPDVEPPVPPLELRNSHDLNKRKLTENCW